MLPFEQRYRIVLPNPMPCLHWNNAIVGLILIACRSAINTA